MRGKRKRKSYITLDTTDLFDDSDIDEEISSFLQDVESEERPLQKSSGSEGKTELKNVEETKNEQKSTADVKSTKGKVKSNQVLKSDPKNASVTKSVKCNVYSDEIGKSDRKSNSDAKSTNSNQVAGVSKTSELTVLKKNEQTVVNKTGLKKNEQNEQTGLNKNEQTVVNKTSEVTETKKNEQTDLNKMPEVTELKKNEQTVVNKTSEVTELKENKQTVFKTGLKKNEQTVVNKTSEVTEPKKNEQTSVNKSSEVTGLKKNEQTVVNKTSEVTGLKKNEQIAMNKTSEVTGLEKNEQTAVSKISEVTGLKKNEQTAEVTGLKKHEQTAVNKMSEVTGLKKNEQTTVSKTSEVTGLKKNEQTAEVTGPKKNELIAEVTGLKKNEQTTEVTGLKKNEQTAKVTGLKKNEQAAMNETSEVTGLKKTTMNKTGLKKNEQTAEATGLKKNEQTGLKKNEQTGLKENEQTGLKENEQTGLRKNEQTAEVTELKKNEQTAVNETSEVTGLKKTSMNKTGLKKNEETEVKKNEQTVVNKTSEVTGLKKNEQTVINKTSEPPGVKKNEQKKTIQVEKKHCKNFEDISCSKSSLQDIVIDDLEFFVDSKKDESGEPDLCLSPVSSEGSELFDSTELEQEIQTFLGKEFVSTKQSDKFVEGESNVKIANDSVKVVGRTEKTEVSKHTSKSDQVKIVSVQKQSSDRDILNKSVSEDKSLKEGPKTKASEDCNPKTESKSLASCNVAVSKVQDFKKEIPSSGLSSKGKSKNRIAPELGMIIGDYEKDEEDEDVASKDELPAKSDAPAEGTKQVNKRKIEERSDTERENKKPRKGNVTSSDYEKQLGTKMEDIKDKLIKASDYIVNVHSKNASVCRHISNNNGLICKPDDIRKCSPSEWMTTICTFYIGHPRQSDDLVVGVKLEESKDKKTPYLVVKSISEVEENYPDHVIGAAKVFEKMIQPHARGKGGRPHPQGFKNVWNGLYIYTNKKQEMMFVIKVIADSTSIIKEINNLYVDFFENGEGKKFRVTSVYITCYYKIGLQNESWIEHLRGSPCLEILRGLYLGYVGFMEPWSNVYGLRMLCHAVEELLMPTRNTTVLEMFCSTGLLGHYLSKLAGEVLAYDHVDVIRSTTKNATRNNATGVQYFSGDRHSEVYYLIDTARYASVTAVINCNPVFNKYHLSNISISVVVKIFREESKIKKFVVVATSKTFTHIPFKTICAPCGVERGHPFFPVKVIPIDTMPLQDGYTVVVLFKREYGSAKEEYSKHVTVPKVKEEWWNWIKDNESDRWKDDKKANEERKCDDRRKKRIDEDEENKQRLEEQMKRKIHGEFDRRRQREMGKINAEEDEKKQKLEQKMKRMIRGELEKRKNQDTEVEGDRAERRRYDDDGDREYVHGMWQRKRREDEEKKKKIEKEREEEERKKLLEEEMKRKLQEQLDIRRLQEISRKQKEEEELRKKEEEERKKKEEEEKAKRLTFFRKRLREEQRRRAQGDQRVETEKEPTDEELLKRKKKEIDEDQKKQAQVKGKKKQLEKEEKKPLEQLRIHIEEEKVRAKRAAERKRQGQTDEKKRRKKTDEENERRQQFGNRRIPVWEQPPVGVGLMEPSNLDEVDWRNLQEENYRRRLEEEAYRKVENDTVVFDYNHGSTMSSAVAAKPEETKRGSMESSTATTSNTVSRPVMKWLEKLREVSGGADVKGKCSVTNTNSQQQISSAAASPGLLPVSTPPPSLLSLKVEKPASLLTSSSDINPSLRSLHVGKPASLLPPSSDINPSLRSLHVGKPTSLLPPSSDINPSLRSLNVGKPASLLPPSSDLNPSLRSLNVGKPASLLPSSSDINPSLRSLNVGKPASLLPPSSDINPSLRSLHVGKPASLLPPSSDVNPSLRSLNVGKPASLLPPSSDGNASRLLSAPIRPLLKPPGFLNISGRDDRLPEIGRSNVGSSIRQSSLSAEPSRPLIEPFSEQQVLSSIAFGDKQALSSIAFGEQQALSNVAVGGQKGLSNVAFGGYDNYSNSRYNYGGSGRNDSHENTGAGLRGMTDLYGNVGAPNLNTYGFAGGGGGRFDYQGRSSGDNMMHGISNTGDIRPTDSFSFKQTLQDMRTYGSSYTGKGQY